MNSPFQEKNFPKSDKTYSSQDDLYLIEDKSLNKIENNNKTCYENSESSSNPSYENNDIVEKPESPNPNLSIIKKHFNYMSKNSNLTILKDMVINEKDTNFKENINIALKFKLQANQAFKDSRYDESLNLFNQCFEIFNQSDDLNEVLNVGNIKSIKIECLCNMSLCYIKIHKYEEALNITDKVMQIQPKNVRNLYLRAKALKYLKKYQESYTILKTALTIKCNSTIIRELKELETNIQKENNLLDESNIKEDDLEEVLYISSNSNILFKIIKVFFYKIFDLIKKQKSLMFLFTIILFYLLKKQLKINFNNFSKIISFIK